MTWKEQPVVAGHPTESLLHQITVYTCYINPTHWQDINK